MKKNKLKKIIIFILILAILCLLYLVITDYKEGKETQEELSSIVEVFDQSIEENFKIESEDLLESEQSIDEQSNLESGITIKGVKVFGKIKIQKINIEYPIIEYVNDNSLWKSICKISDNNIDGTGNLCLAGHNMRNATMFTRLKELNIGDKVEITNTDGELFIYEVFENIEVNQEQVEILENTDESIITLITCKTLDYSKRVIVKAKKYEL